MAQYQANGYQVWAPTSIGSSPVAVFCDIAAQFMEKNPTLTDKILSGSPALTIVGVYCGAIGGAPWGTAVANANAAGVAGTTAGQYGIAAWCLRSLIAGTPDLQLKRTDGSSSVAASSAGVAITPVSVPAPSPDVQQQISAGGGSAAITVDASGTPQPVADVAPTVGPVPTSTDDGTAAPPDDTGGGVPSFPAPAPTKKTALVVGGGLGILGLGYLWWRSHHG